MPDRTTPSDERARPEVDDWHWDWVEEPEQAGGQSRPAPASPGSSRTGLIPRGDSEAGHDAAHARHQALTRRRRLVALAALALLFVLALVIPLVVFSGGGSSVEQTTAATTTAQATTPQRTATTATTPTTTTTTTQASPTQTTPLSVTLPANGELRRGDRGSSVTQLQRGLVALGFAAGTPDGIFGATTEAAVSDFQRSNNLTPDGIAGADTVRLLNTALADKARTG